MVSGGKPFVMKNFLLIVVMWFTAAAAGRLHAGTWWLGIHPMFRAISMVSCCIPPHGIAGDVPVTSNCSVVPTTCSYSCIYIQDGQEIHRCMVVSTQNLCIQGMPAYSGGCQVPTSCDRPPMGGPCTCD